VRCPVDQIFPQGSGTVDSVEIIYGLHPEVLQTLRGLHSVLEFVEEEQFGLKLTKVRSLHASFPEFLHDKDRAGTYYVDREQAFKSYARGPWSSSAHTKLGEHTLSIQFYLDSTTSWLTLGLVIAASTNIWYFGNSMMYLHHFTRRTSNIKRSWSNAWMQMPRKTGEPA
jgi:hypothetical protein